MLESKCLEAGPMDSQTLGQRIYVNDYVGSKTQRNTPKASVGRDSVSGNSDSGWVIFSGRCMDRQPNCEGNLAA